MGIYQTTKQIAIHVKELIRDPRGMGSVMPSSRFLARSMAGAIPREMIGSGKIVELGAGTGVVTKAIFGRGVSVRDLYVVERSSHLADMLSMRFPGAQVLCRSADDIAGEIAGPVRAVISSLPFRSLPEDLCVSIMKEIERILAPGGLYVQFTYALLGPLPYAPPGFEEVGSSLTLFNVPPAKVVVLRKPV